MGSVKLSVGCDGDDSSAAREPVGIIEWTDAMNECLIDALLRQEAIGNRANTPDRRFSSKAYFIITSEIRQKFGLCFDKRHVKNRLKSIKENFFECYDLFEKRRGFSWNPESKTWDAQSDAWEAYIEEKPDARRWMRRPIYHYDKLLELYGKYRDKRFECEKPIEREKGRRLLRSCVVGSALAGTTRTTEEIVEDDEVFGRSVSKRHKTRERDLFEGSSYQVFVDQENGLAVPPVPADAFGKGLPYAPVDWPKSGDIWCWEVGHRKSSSGYWVDRYLYPPARYCDCTGRKSAFKSKLQVEEFIRKEFPDIDLDFFFSSFVWKIPSTGDTPIKGAYESDCDMAIKKDHSEPTNSARIDLYEKCKARNAVCSLQKAKSEQLPMLGCNICCAEAGFCRDCCCILCAGSIDWSCGGYNFIKCVAVLYDDYVCGHVAHIKCALRCHLAGTVMGTFDLDAEYYCRRCDKKTDLIPLATKYVDACKSLKSSDEIETVLQMCICVLRGSKQTRAKSLQNYIGFVLSKLKSGIGSTEIWKIREINFIRSELRENWKPCCGTSVRGNAETFQGEELTKLFSDRKNSVGDGPCATSEQVIVSKKLEDLVNKTLNELQKSQEREYRIAEEALHGQKDNLLGLYQLLDFEGSELANLTHVRDGANPDAIRANIASLEEQIKSAEDEIQKMLKVAHGFGQTSEATLRQHFGVVADD